MKKHSKKELAYIARWKKLHPARVKAHREAYRKRHDVKGLVKAWKEANPDKVQASREREAKKSQKTLMILKSAVRDWTISYFPECTYLITDSAVIGFRHFPNQVLPYAVRPLGRITRKEASRFARFLKVQFIS